MLHKITIADYMTRHLVTFTKDREVFDAVKVMIDHKITCAPVVDDQGKLLGMFSEMDCLKAVSDCAYNQGMSGKVGDYMTTNAMTVNGIDNIVDLAEKFSTLPVRSFPVMENGQMVGIISRTDLLRAFATGCNAA